MAQAYLDFKNILAIHFGQLGDVVLGLPALRAIRDRFPDAKFTIASGKSTAEVIRLADVCDEQISIDRVKLRDGNKLSSIREIIGIVRNIRKRRFDLVIDLNSLYETNLLGFLSGARYRLYANRENRSLDILSKFPEKPPPEDRSRHVARRYLDVLRPLGIIEEIPRLDLRPAEDDLAEIRQILAEREITDEILVGIFLGAGHPGRRWPLEKYAELTRLLSADTRIRILVFMGPEERDLVPDVERAFPPTVIILDKLRLLPLFAALTFLDVFVGNDTGPTHLAAATKAWLVLISHVSAPAEFMPLTDRLTVIKSSETFNITADEVYRAITVRLENDISSSTC